MTATSKARSQVAVARALRRQVGRVVDMATDVDRIATGGQATSKYLDELHAEALRLRRLENEYREITGRDYRR